MRMTILVLFFLPLMTSAQNLERDNTRAELIAQQDARLKSGDFSLSDNCRHFLIDPEKEHSDENRIFLLDKDFISELSGVKIRPSGDLVVANARLEDSSNSWLTLRNANGSDFIILEITESTIWFNESSTSIGQSLTIVGFYERNADEPSFFGQTVKVPVLRAVCIAPGDF